MTTTENLDSGARRSQQRRSAAVALERTEMSRRVSLGSFAPSSRDERGVSATALRYALGVAHVSFAGESEWRRD